MSPFWTVVISNLYIITLCQKYVFVDDAISSLDADAECFSRHGTPLASIHNIEDNAQAQALCKPQPTDEGSACWIGLHVPSDSTLFKWYDGTPVDYQNWRPGEPNEYIGRGGDDLVSILADTGQWNDEYIGTHLRLICWNVTYWNPFYIPPTVQRTEQKVSWALDTHVIAIIIAILIILFIICCTIILLNRFGFVLPWLYKRKPNTDTVDESDNSEGQPTLKTLPTLPPDKQTMLKPQYSAKSNATTLTCVSTTYDSYTVGMDDMTVTTAVPDQSVWKGYVAGDVPENKCDI